jgi:predicted secreted protein
MSLATALAAFFVIWWLSLFIILPLGIRSQHEATEDDIVPGTDPGAPSSVRFGRKLLWTTALAIAIYACCYVIYAAHLVTLSGLMGRFDYGK